MVAALLDAQREVAALHDDDVLDGRRVLDGVVGVVLEGDDLAAPVAAVGGDEDLGLGVVDAVAQGLGAEAAEDDRVDGADAGAGQHGDDGLRHHRHVDGDAVALLDAEALQGVGEQVDLAVEVPVGEHAPVAGLALPDDGGLVALAGLDVAVAAVVAGVDLAADEPPGVRRVPLQRLLPGLEPVQPLGGVLPEADRVLPGPFADLAAAHVGGSPELVRWLQPAALLQQVRKLRLFVLPRVLSHTTPFPYQRHTPAGARSAGRPAPTGCSPCRRTP